MSLNENIITVKAPKDISTEEHLNLLKISEKNIMLQPDSSVLMLTILGERNGNQEMINNHRAFSKRVSHKIKKSAVVGAGLTTGIVIKGIQLLTNREIKTFSTESEATSWLKS